MNELEALKNVIENCYVEFAAIAAAVAVIWGFVKAVGALKKWLTARKDDMIRKAQHEQKITNLVQTIDSRIADINHKFNDINNKLNLMDNQFQKIETSVDKLDTKIKELKIDLYNNNQATATVMLKQMMSSYHKYVIEQHPIPLSVQIALCQMFDKYKVYGWHNHVPQDFKEKIKECKIL